MDENLILRLYRTGGEHTAWIKCTNIPWNAEWLDYKTIFLQKKMFNLITFRFSSIPMHVPNLGVQEKGKLASKWKKTFANVMK